MTRTENPFRRLPDPNPFKPTKDQTFAVPSGEASADVDSDPPAEQMASVTSISTARTKDELPAADGDKAWMEAQLAIVSKAARAREAKALMDQATARYDQLRQELWELVGRTPGENPYGRFKFTPPKGRRSTDFDLLEAEYPEAYRAAVSKAEPKADAVGSLYL